MAWLGGSGAVALMGLLVTWAVKSWGVAYSAGEATGEAKASYVTRMEADERYVSKDSFKAVQDDISDIKKEQGVQSSDIKSILRQTAPVYGPQPQ